MKLHGKEDAMFTVDALDAPAVPLLCVGKQG
jgi:hypothetical protein